MSASVAVCVKWIGCARSVTSARAPSTTDPMSWPGPTVAIGGTFIDRRLALTEATDAQTAAAITAIAPAAGAWAAATTSDQKMAATPQNPQTRPSTFTVLRRSIRRTAVVKNDVISGVAANRTATSPLGTVCSDQ